MSDLEGRWVLVSVSGHSVNQNQSVYFRVNKGVLTGYDGCNRFGGPLTGAIRATGRGCEPSGAELPLDLADPAEHLSRAKREGDLLLLPLEDGSVAEFRRKDD